jgi:hypothetical protein
MQASPEKQRFVGVLLRVWTGAHALTPIARHIGAYNSGLTSVRAGAHRGRRNLSASKSQ